MSHIQITVPHRLSQDEAVERIRNLPTSLEQEFAGRVSDIRQEWEGNVARFHFTAAGFAISGKADVQPDKAEIGIDLPLLASPFKGRIADAIERRATQLLA